MISVMGAKMDRLWGFGEVLRAVTRTRPDGRVHPPRARTRPFPKRCVSGGLLRCVEPREVPVPPLHHFADRGVVPAGAVLRRYTILVQLGIDCAAT